MLFATLTSLWGWKGWKFLEASGVAPRFVGTFESVPFEEGLSAIDSWGVELIFWSCAFSKDTF